MGCDRITILDGRAMLYFVKIDEEFMTIIWTDRMANAKRDNQANMQKIQTQLLEMGVVSRMIMTRTSKGTTCMLQYIKGDWTNKCPTNSDQEWK